MLGKVGGTLRSVGWAYECAKAVGELMMVSERIERAWPMLIHEQCHRGGADVVVGEWAVSWAWWIALAGGKVDACAHWATRRGLGHFSCDEITRAQTALSEHHA